MSRFVILVCSKGRKKGYDEYEIVLILEQNIRVFLGLHKLTHGLTFGIIYFNCKNYGQWSYMLLVSYKFLR